MSDYNTTNEVIVEGQDNGVTIAADDTFILGKAPFPGRVTSISYTPEAASTGDNTNRRTYTVVNKGASGAGTTVMGTLDLITGVDLVASDEKAFTLSVVANAINFVAGDVIALVSTHVASGLVDPGGIVTVKGNRLQS